VTFNKVHPPATLSKKKLLQFLNALRSLEGTFIEETKRGKQRGRLFLRRPQGQFGQVRLVYRYALSIKPRLELLSEGKTLHILDYKNRTHETVGLEATPLLLLLRPQIRFGNLLQAEEPWFNGQHFVCRLKDPSQPEAYVELFLRPLKTGKDAFFLEGWRIRDLQMNETRITFEEVRLNQPSNTPFVVPTNFQEGS
jgi:outer membrane lipoprotein-sorting protein